MVLGPGDKIWCLDKNRPEVKVFDESGKPVAAFEYNRYGPIDKNWLNGNSFSRQISIEGSNIFVFDGWEGILHLIIHPEN